MDQQTCPHLGTLDAQNSQQPGIEYPSFENHCFADPNFVDNALLLGDQATYCLFGGCHHCPRFQDAQRFSGPAFSEFSGGFAPSPASVSPTSHNSFKPSNPALINPAPIDSASYGSNRQRIDPVQSGPVQSEWPSQKVDYTVGTDAPVSDQVSARADFGAGGVGVGVSDYYEDDGFDGDDEYFEAGRRVPPVWLLAGMLFLGSVLCASVIFFSVSFQAVRGNLAGFFSPSAPQGQIYAVDQSQPATGASSSILIVITATPDPILAGVSEREDGVQSSDDRVAQAPEEENESIVNVGSGEGVEQSTETESNGPGSRSEEEDQEDDAAKSTEKDDLAIIAPTPTIDFPKAVTPTPIVSMLDQLGNRAEEETAADDSADVSAPDEETSANPRFIPAPTSTPVPEINVQILVPTPPANVPAPALAPAPPVPQVLPEQVSNVAAQPVQPVQPNVANNPAVSNPAADSPVADSPAADSPAADSPAADSPAADSPAAEADSVQEEVVVEENTAEPTATPLPTATWPPPLVLFGAKDSALMAGECTEIRWTVENVQAVYVENVPTNGSGDREECIKDADETFELAVVLPDGATKIYTTTVRLLLPTVTPTATPTFTPVPIPTATWTPLPPPPTPTPAFVYGVSLAASGSTLSCTAGSICEIGITLTNIGNTTDNLAVFVERGGEWLPSLCRSDGVCSENRLVVAGVGQSNTAPLTLRFDIPAGSAPKNESYIFRASSELSGGAARSESVTIDVKVE